MLKVLTNTHTIRGRPALNKWGAMYHHTFTRFKALFMSLLLRYEWLMIELVLDMLFEININKITLHKYE